MSPPGRPKGEYRSAQRVGCLMSPPGRAKGEYRSAQHGGCLMSRRAVPKPVLSLVEGANAVHHCTEVAW